jgi:hypothetical protein
MMIGLIVLIRRYLQYSVSAFLTWVQLGPVYLHMLHDI